MRKALLIILILIMFNLISVYGGIKLEFIDPIGDDNGPGTYTYPTDPVYKPGSFDLTKFTVKDKGKTVELAVTVRTNLENPWQMASGFSIQMAFVFIDMDGKPKSGHPKALPGLNAEFADCCYWEKAVIISPQPSSRVKAEIKEKAKELENDIIVPIKVIPRGKTFTAIIRKEDLGADVQKTWGWQILLTSNEGFPGPHEILTRRVNEYAGQHRFGGGDDYDGDPHFMDMIVPPAKGTKAEIDLQHKILSQYVSGPDPSKWVWVKLPMVYPAKEISITVPEEKPVKTPTVQVLPSEKMAKKEEKFGLKISGKVFMNWLYGNDDTQFSAYIAPFGGGGHNGINSELELNLSAKVTEYVEIGARIKNRFRNNFWATYWNNDDLEKAQYMKLRGVWARLRTPDWLHGILDTIYVGSSDLGMFSPWTIGRIRYIDRDNAAGTFLSAKVSDFFSYNLARISLPSLWAGPGWSTAGKGYHTSDGFINRDFAYAASLDFNISQGFFLRLIGYHTIDVEGDPEDDNPRDGISYYKRFRDTVISAEFDASPYDFLQINGMFANASTKYNDLFDYIEKWGGANNMPQKDCNDNAYKLTVQLQDPFDIGLSFAVEYFNIGEDFISIMASRREQDVLLTEGFEADDISGRDNANGFEQGKYAFDWGGWDGTRGQSPSTMPDNNETQYDETAFESIIGWKGITTIVSFGRGGLDLSGEFTKIDYNTNKQNRDMSVYPSSQNIWFEDQDRNTTIALIKGKYSFDIGKTMDISGKVKLIHDIDKVSIETSADDYESKKWIYDIGIGLQITDELYSKIGYTLYDDNITLGGDDRSSEKNKIYLQVKYNFGGVKIGYNIERFTGTDWYEGSQYSDWKLIRSRAFLEIAF